LRVSILVRCEIPVAYPSGHVSSCLGLYTGKSVVRPGIDSGRGHARDPVIAVQTQSPSSRQSSVMALQKLAPCTGADGRAGMVKNPQMGSVVAKWSA
jgi:hypothetical protein